MAPVEGVNGFSGTISSVESSESVVVATRAVKSVPQASGRRTPTVALVALSTSTSSTITLAGEIVAGSIGAEKRTVADALVEKPSSALMVAAFGRNGVTGEFSVPSVDPAK